MLQRKCRRRRLYVSPAIRDSSPSSKIKISKKQPINMALRACRRLMKAVKAVREAADDENNDEIVETFTMADEDEIMTHMMDCVALLAAMQKEEQHEDIPANSTEAQTSRNKVFMAALSTVGGSLLNIEMKASKKRTTAAIDELLEAFPVPDETHPVPTGREGWLPLHWAVALMPSDQYNVTEADVKTLYALDPMAMQSKHVADDSDGEYVGFTPAHLLCMSPVTQCSMQLVRLISVCSPSAFTPDATFSALHVACCYGTPTVELLQHLLQLDSSQAKVLATFSFRVYEHCPLGHLCANLVKWADELPNADDLVKCLLEVDKSKEVVGDAICGCLQGYYGLKAEDGAMVDRRNSFLYGMIEMLLKVNPEAAKHRDSTGYNVLHLVCLGSFPSKLCIDITKLVLALHKDAVREQNEYGCLPVHHAAQYSDLEVMEFLLGLYREAASVVNSDGENLLHLAVSSRSKTNSAVLNVKYLCSRYPAMMQQRDNEGKMPVHSAVHYGFKTTLALYEAGGIEQFKMPIAHPAGTHLFNGYLPLHHFLRSPYHNDEFTLPATSAVADLFRWLLRLYPEAAGIEGGVGAGKKRTPYQLAVNKKLPNYYLRLLLRAAPTLNPAELHRLNYAERRMAMFLAFKAVTARLQKPFLLARLRGVNKDLVQRVITFL
jgi:ankyrin repeat protein